MDLACIHINPWRTLKFDGPTVSVNPLTDSSGTDIFLPSNSWSIKITTTVISSWKNRLTPFSTFLRSSYLISLFLAATFKAALRSLLAIPWHFRKKRRVKKNQCRKDKREKYDERNSSKEKHTVLGYLYTISAASWFVMCSQSPSDANMINLSFGCKTLVQMDGSDVSTGLRIGSGRWNRGNEGSRENSGLFKYASPIDLDTWYQCRGHKKENKLDSYQQSNCHFSMLQANNFINDHYSMK